MAQLFIKHLLIALLTFTLVLLQALVDLLPQWCCLNVTTGVYLYLTSALSFLTQNSRQVGPFFLVELLIFELLPVHLQFE